MAIKRFLFIFQYNILKYKGSFLELLIPLRNLNIKNLEKIKIYWKVLWENKNSSSLALLQNPFWNLYFKERNEDAFYSQMIDLWFTERKIGTVNNKSLFVVISFNTVGAETKYVSKTTVQFSRCRIVGNSRSEIERVYHVNSFTKLANLTTIIQNACARTLCKIMHAPVVLGTSHLFIFYLLENS